MTDRFDEILGQIAAQLREEKRISYRLLKRRFDLTDDDIEDVRDELVHAKRLATDEGNRVLVWREAKTGSGAQPAERRHLTVAFFDLADSTRISSALDPEDFRDIILAYQRLVVSAILPYEGYIAQYLGDGVLVYFGYPSAREDDAQRAVEASLDVVEAFREIARDLRSRYAVEPAIRVGIHSGLVVLGDVGVDARTEQIAIGDAPNVAARLQAQAGPNQIVIGQETHDLVRYLFEFESRGALQLKGIPQPVSAYTCIRRLRDRGRFHVLVHRKLSDLHGREQEIRQLSDLWLRVRQGGSAVVLVEGEAGIGKTRLLAEASNRLVDDRESRLLIECSPFHQGTYLHPIIRYLEKRFGIADEDDSEHRRDRLLSAAAGFDFADDQWLALMGSLLSIDPARLAPLAISPRRQKELTQDAVIRLMREDASTTRDLCIVDDLHWCDPSTLEFLSRLVDEPIPGMLLAMTCRPEFHNPWDGVSCVRLGSVSGSEAERIVRSADAHGLLSDEVVHEIVARADGIPLFLEELTQTLLAEQHNPSGGARSSAAQIPLTLQDSLFARLDRLPFGKKVAQLGSVIGRDFSHELLDQVWEGRQEDLQTGLHELTGSGLLGQSRHERRPYYTFKHALVRDAAYESLLIRRREQFHLAVAKVMEAGFAESGVSQPEILAHHFTAGLEYRQAVKYWQLSGARAQQRSAHVEAVEHLRRALDCLRRAPGEPNRVETELTLLNQKGTSLIAIEGYASAHVGDVYTEASRLCGTIGDRKLQFDTFQGLWAFHLVRGDLGRARELSDELEQISLRDNQPEYVLEALLRQGISLSMLGDLPAAADKFEQVLSLYDAERDHEHRLLYGQDPLVSCLCHYALVLCLMGYPDQALARTEAACRLALEMAHPFTLSWAYLYSALVRYLRREPAAAREAAARLTRLCSEQAFAYRLAQGRIIEGWADGDDVEGARAVRQAIDAVRGTGALVFAGYYYSILAEIELPRSPASAIDVLDEGLRVTARTGEGIFRTELLRLRAEALAGGRADPAPVRDLLEQAERLAQLQGARSQSLKIAASRFRLEEGDAARQRLAECVAGMSEGCSLRDYREASALLDVG